MAALFASGRIVDLIVLLMVGEAVLLIALRRRLGTGSQLGGLLANLAAGFFLLLALRGALVGAGWMWIAAALAGALAAHVADQAQRLAR